MAAVRLVRLRHLPKFQLVRQTPGTSVSDRPNPVRDVLQVGANAQEPVRVRGSWQNAIQVRSAPAHRAGMPGRSGAWRWPHTL